MAKLTDLTAEMTVAPAPDDLLHIVDRSDTSEDPAGSSKKIQTKNLLANATLWTTVGNAGSIAQYNSIQDAITAGKYDLVIIGNFNETKNITVGANSVNIKITDTCNLGTFEITMNGAGDFTVESGKITYAYTSPGEAITNAGTGTLHMHDLISDGTASTTTASLAIGGVNSRMQIDNCRCFLSNTTQAGFINAYNSSSITNTIFIGGGATCTGAIVNLAGGIASNISFEGTFLPNSEIISLQNAASIINGLHYNAIGRGKISLYIDHNQIDNVNGDLILDLRDTTDNQISNCYIEEIDLTDNSCNSNKFANVHGLSNNITIAGNFNKFVNFECDANIIVNGDNNLLCNALASDLTYGAASNDNAAHYCSFSTYTDNGTGNTYTEVGTEVVDGSSTDRQIPTAKATYDAIIATKTKTIYIEVTEPNTNLGNGRERNIASTGAYRFSFDIPGDFVSWNTNGCKIQGVPAAAVATTGRNIDYSGEYGNVGEAYNDTTFSDVITVYDFTGRAGQYTNILNFTSFLSGVTAGDRVHVFIDHNSVGAGGISYGRFALHYNYTP